MRTEGRVEYSSLNSMPMRMLREKVQFLYLPPDRPERAMQSRPLVESGNSLCHPRIAATHAPSLSRALPLPAPPSPCPSFPRQSSLKEGAARSMSLLCNEEPAARCILACSACTLARSRSSAHPRSTSTTPRRGGSGKIKSRLHCTWAPRASYVRVIYNRYHFQVLEGSTAPKDMSYGGMALEPPSLQETLKSGSLMSMLMSLFSDSSF